jgi:hypothetical protein
VAERVEDLTVNYEEDGRPVVEELDKEILSKGAWATVLFRYRQLDSKTGEFGPEKFVIRRYRKMGGQYRPQSKFNISSRKQARHIVDTLSRWIAESGEE